MHRTENIFKQLDERSLTADEEKIIQQRVSAVLLSYRMMCWFATTADGCAALSQHHTYSPEMLAAVCVHNTRRWQ